MIRTNSAIFVYLVFTTCIVSTPWLKGLGPLSGRSSAARSSAARSSTGRSSAARTAISLTLEACLGLAQEASFNWLFAFSPALGALTAWSGVFPTSALALNRRRGGFLQPRDNPPGDCVGFPFIEIVSRPESQFAFYRWATLLHHMGQLVRQELLPFSRGGIVGRVPEENILSSGERNRTQMLIERIWLRSRMHADPAEIGAKGMLHLPLHARIERPATAARALNRRFHVRRDVRSLLRPLLASQGQDPLYVAIPVLPLQSQ
jgi:hypothetical protein